MTHSFQIPGHNYRDLLEGLGVISNLFGVPCRIATADVVVVAGGYPTATREKPVRALVSEANERVTVP